jgi:hypothetical protein
MARGNYTPFRAKHVDSIEFGSTAWSETDMDSTTIALDTSYATNNSSNLINLAAGSSVDAVNPTATACWAKDFSESGNERSTSEENLLGSDSTGSQCQELSADTISKITVEFTLIYRNIAYNNIVVTHVGSLTRNADGFMEQKVKFECRGGQAGSAITVTQSSPAESWSRYRLGQDKAEEIRTA